MYIRKAIINKYCQFFVHEIHANGFICYAISNQDEQVLHLSFSEARHLAALRLIAESFSGAGIEKRPGGAVNSQVSAYLRGETRHLPLPAPEPFIVVGTEFQQRVWRLIADIPYGRTKTYGELAALLKKKGAARAVGQACNANPLALLIPCHRVVGVGSIGGFAGGAAVKERLLQMERNEKNEAPK